MKWGGDLLNRKKGVEKLYVGATFLLAILLVFLTSLFGEMAYGKPEGKSEEKVGFELAISDGLISLSAKDASLREIMGEIGNSMIIEVVGNIPEEEKISVDFDRLSLEDALEKLSSNYGYLMDAEKGGNKIAEIIIIPKGEESRIQEIESKEQSRPEPFKFEFDPLESMGVRE